VPNFVTNAGEEVYVAPSRPVFRRGKRLDEPTVRRIRDILMSLLASLGCDSEDIARVTASTITSRQVRNRVHKDMPVDFRDALENIAIEVIASAHKRVAARPARSRVTVVKPPPRHRQLSLKFGDEEVSDERLVRT
jgi:hypothetical protein